MKSNEGGYTGFAPVGFCSHFSLHELRLQQFRGIVDIIIIEKTDEPLDFIDVQNSHTL